MTDSPPTDPPSDAISLVLAFGNAMHVSGVPAHRLEATLTELAEHAGLQSQFFSTPTSLFAAFGPPGAQQVSLLRLAPGAVHLGSLSRIDAWARAYLAGTLSAGEATARLRELPEQTSARHRAGMLAVYGLASAAGARFFGGELPEITAAGILGVALGLLAAFAQRRHSVGQLFTLGGALLASCAAGLASAEPYLAQPSVVTLAGVLVLLPGFTLTVAMTELSTGHLASGTARLAGALVTFVQLGFGVALGAQLAPWTFGPSDAPPLPAWADAVALAVAPGALAATMRVRLADGAAVYGAALIAFTTARAFGATFGAELGAAAGSLAVGLATNAYGRSLDRPAFVPLVPAILMLVPGSVGLRSVMSLLGHDAISGVSAAFQMVLIAMGIVAGQLVATALLPPRHPVG